MTAPALEGLPRSDDPSDNRDGLGARTPVMLVTRHTRPVRDTTVRRGLAVVVTTAAALVVLLSTGTPAASAHDEVVATVPARGTTVPAPPERVELEVSAPPQVLGTLVLVSGPDGAPVSQGRVELRGTAVVQPLAGDLPAGTYTVAWRVTSSDGHPLAGSFDFTVAGGATAAPGDPGAAGATPEQGTAPDGARTAAAQDAGASTPTATLAVGAGLLVAAGSLVVRQRRRRS